MRLLYLTSRLPFPLNKGDRLRAYYQLKYLNQKHEIYLVCFNDEGKVSEEQRQAVEGLCSSYRIIDLNKLGIGQRLLMATTQSDLPYQVHYFYSKNGQEIIDGIIDQFKPHHIFSQLIRTSEYVRNSSISKTLDMMDALSVGMQRRSNVSGFFEKLIFENEAKRLSQYEKNILKDFDNIIMISKNDASVFKDNLSDQIHIVPNGISPQFLDGVDVPKQYDLSFVGNLSYAPNVEAAVFLVKEILPILLEKRKNLKILIAGANPVNRVLSLAGKHVKILANPDDIRMAYASSKVFVAPMKIGSGLQNKLLEAMALGIPSVTTTLANAALNAIPGEEILVADSAHGLSAQIELILNNPPLAERLSINSRKLITENYCWNNKNEQIEKIILNNT